MKNCATLPIGRTARIAYELDALRGACCKAARASSAGGPADENGLADCARLDDALAVAQRLLKAAVRDIMLSRLSRNSQIR